MSDVLNLDDMSKIFEERRVVLADSRFGELQQEIGNHLCGGRTCGPRVMFPLTTQTDWRATAGPSEKYCWDPSNITLLHNIAAFFGNDVAVEMLHRVVKAAEFKSQRDPVRNPSAWLKQQLAIEVNNHTTMALSIDATLKEAIAAALGFHGREKALQVWDFVANRELFVIYDELLVKHDNNSSATKAQLVTVLEMTYYFATKDAVPKANARSWLTTTLREQGHDMSGRKSPRSGKPPKPIGTMRPPVQNAYQLWDHFRMMRVSS